MKQQNKVLFFIGILFLLSISLVQASLLTSKDLTFTVNQTDFYFKTGTDAIIPIKIQNTLGKTVYGLLTDTYTQNLNQAGMSFSSTNSQSITLNIPKDNSIKQLDFGTSKNPAVLSIDLKYIYTDGDQKIIHLKNIKIHFVNNNNQQQNTNAGQTAKSEKYSSSKNSNSQDPFSQMQNKLNQAMNNNQQPNQQSNSLENNQMSQDSSALKKEMTNQIKQQEQMQKLFQKQLTKNSEFQKQHQQLLQQGYNLSDAEFNPESNNTGDFKISYKKPTGEEASIDGRLENGTLKRMQKDTPETRQEAMTALEKNKDFQKFQKQLSQKGYFKNKTNIFQEKNQTTIKLTYQNKKNETATIEANLINKTVKGVELNSNMKTKHDFWPWLIIILILLFLAIAYWIKNKKQVKKEVEEETKSSSEEIEIFDYKKESIKLLNRSKRLFKQQKPKEAFEVANQSVRLYLSYKYGLEKELTNEELLSQLDLDKKTFFELKECFEICSLVEFAKYSPNKTDFKNVIVCVEKIIK